MGAVGIPFLFLASDVLADDVFAQGGAYQLILLHGGDRIYLIGDDNRLRALPVRRAGERRDGGTLTLLVRPATATEALARGTRILATHLPHAIDGLAVEVVGAAR